ncbi:MAG: phosphate propanoyltransferase [Spirochaetales bacterium]|nr:phosphate propanoyltransferase [Candidatus Physcosoma equi]
MAKEFLVETSARHVHVTQETLEKLFGAGYQLTVKKELSQPGQFASNERVTVVGPKKELANVSILGPCRKLNQVELSATDARSIGIDAPIRESGDVAGSGACKLVGPCGEVELSEGVIVAKRHIHMTEADAAEMGVKNGEIVNVLIENGNGRKTIFGDTVIRVSNSYALAMHVDTDESNAASCARAQMGTIVK